MVPAPEPPTPAERPARAQSSNRPRSSTRAQRPAREPSARKSSAEDVRTVVFTDGACLGNPGPGGWAWAVPDGPFRSGPAAKTTNQRMEISAVLDAVRNLEGPLDVVSDSTYVVNCFRDRWWEGWMARGWKNSQKKDVANRDLWEPLIDAYRAEPSRLHVRWVKGHSGDPMNDLVDRLAVEAATTQQPRSGTGTPTLLGPPDRPARARASEEAATVTHEPPKGYLIAVTGVRPPALGGYGETPTAVTARRLLTEILGAKAEVEPETTVLTGLGLGIEQLAAEAAEAAGVPYVGVLAFPGQEQAWPEASRTRFEELVANAQEVRTLQHRQPTSKQAAAGAFARRDAWIARAAAEAIVVWDGRDAAIGKALRSLQDHLGEEQVWVVEP